MSDYLDGYWSNSTKLWWQIRIEEQQTEIDRLRALNAELVKWLTAAVFSIKANSEGKPISSACPWSLAWYQPALDVLAKHAGIMPEPSPKPTD